MFLAKPRILVAVAVGQLGEEPHQAYPVNDICHDLKNLWVRGGGREVVVFKQQLEA